MSCRTRSYSRSQPDLPLSKFLVLLEEHAEADDSPVDQQASDYRHEHGFDLDEIGMRKNDR